MATNFERLVPHAACHVAVTLIAKTQKLAAQTHREYMEKRAEKNARIAVPFFLFFFFLFFVYFSLFPLATQTQINLIKYSLAHFAPPTCLRSVGQDKRVKVL